MKNIRYTTEAKIRIFREAESADMTTAAVCRKHQISEQSFYKEALEKKL